MSWVTFSVPNAPEPFACTRRSGITSRSKCASFSMSHMSCKATGPRTPAVIEFWLSATGAPAALVRVRSVIALFLCISGDLFFGETVDADRSRRQRAIDEQRNGNRAQRLRGRGVDRCGGRALPLERRGNRLDAGLDVERRHALHRYLRVLVVGNQRRSMRGTITKLSIYII